MHSLRALAMAGGLALGAAFVVGTAWAGDVEITPAAREHFRAGVNFLDDPDGARYDEAYREFKAAYEIARSWKILGNIGLTSMKLERDGEAVDAYRQYLKEGGDQIDKDERAQVERDLQTLEAGVVTVTIEMDPAGTTLVDERFPDSGSNIINRYEPQKTHLELGVRQGRHTITARHDGYADETWTFETNGQRKFSHAFKLKRAESAGPAGLSGEGHAQSSSRPIPTSVYVVGGISVGAAVAGGVVGVLATSKRAQYDTANANQTTTGQHDNAANLRKDGMRLNLIADLCFAGAAVGAGVTIVLYASRPSRIEQGVGSLHGTRNARLEFVPIVTKESAGGVLSGRF